MILPPPDKDIILESLHRATCAPWKLHADVSCKYWQCTYNLTLLLWVPMLPALMREQINS